MIIVCARIRHTDGLRICLQLLNSKGVSVVCETIECVFDVCDVHYCLCIVIILRSVSSCACIDIYRNSLNSFQTIISYSNFCFVFVLCVIFVVSQSFDLFITRFVHIYIYSKNYTFIRFLTQRYNSYPSQVVIFLFRFQILCFDIKHI